ncbi:MAG TPA: AraC family transcriptional regulator [Symbiobacteriaceae bacterium]|nr:AraC family transcriptional regulator [Symbiobacteriaceae bacterium]
MRMQGVGAVAGQHTEMDEIIAFIHQHLYDPLSLSRLAAYAGYSPYHFTRMFKDRTGLPPLYFVSALRLQKAKDLLLRTDMSVREIGLEIGQQSLGTFTTRFTERVGMTPSDFRHSTPQANYSLRSLQGLSDWQVRRPDNGAVIEGTVQAPLRFAGATLIGLFPKPVPEGLPQHGTLIPGVGDFRITGVKPGIYYLMATAVAWEMNAMDFLLPQTTLRARAKEPIIVGPYASVPHQQIMLHLPRQDDPPILISLPVLMNQFLTRVGENSNR